MHDRLSLAAVALCALAIEGRGEEGPPAGPGAGAAPREPRGKVRWVSLADGLAAARRDYRPVIVAYRGGPGPPRAAPDGPPGAAAGFAADLAAFLDSPETAKVLAAFACAEVDAAALGAPYPPPKGRDAAPADGKGGKAAPKRGPGGDPRPPGAGDAGPDPAGAKGEARRPPAGDRLGIVEGEPALVVIDYREKVIRRWQEKLPKADVLRRELRGIAAEAARAAGEARRVEKILDAATYSWAMGETRDAVLAVVPLDDPKVQRGLDPVLADRLASLIARWKGSGTSAIATGIALESERRYLEAVKAYEQAGRKYPFPEIVRLSGRRGADAWRRARGEM